MPSKNSLKIDQDERTCGASINGIPILILGGNSWKVKDNVYEKTREIHKAFSSTGYTGQTMKSESEILRTNIISKDVKYTCIGDRDSKRETFFTIDLPKRVCEIQNKTFDELDLEGQGFKSISPSNIINFYTRLEILLGLTLIGHSDTLTEASNLLDELYKRGEIQNKH